MEEKKWRTTFSTTTPPFTCNTNYQAPHLQHEEPCHQEVYLSYYSLTVRRGWLLHNRCVVVGCFAIDFILLSHMRGVYSVCVLVAWSVSPVESERESNVKKGK